MKRIAAFACLALLVLAATLAVNTLRLPKPGPAPAPGAPLPAFDENAAIERLAGAIRIPTISHEDRARIDAQAFATLSAHLAAQFPRVHAALAHETVNEHSHLYRWAGSDPAAAPLLFLAHLDVVPVEPGTETEWQHGPFSGDVADGFVWGRGTLDDKASALAWLEAAEALLGAGFTPRRTLYFAFGHDEEVGGRDGAQAIAALLRERGVQPEFVLDEGGAITQGLVAGVDQPVASIMAAEKGYVSFRLRTRGGGGHSSMPPAQTAAGQLARAVARVQDQPMPARLVPPVTDMLARIAPVAPLAQRVAIANRWLLGPLVVRALSRVPVTDALIRTTTAPTMLQAGVKDNVLPAQAEAVINFRLLPGDTLEDVEAHLRAVIADDGVAIERLETFANEASPVSPTDTDAFRLLERVTRMAFPEALVSTGLVVGGTDARHYQSLARLRYNFTPVLLRREDLARIHGHNERIATTSYTAMVRWNMLLLREAQ